MEKGKQEFEDQSTGISRRLFLKGAAAVAGGVAAAGALVGCGKPTDASTSASKEGAGEAAAEWTEMSLKPGTYTASAQGNASTVELEATFSETALTDIKVLSQGETPGLWSQVESELIPEMVETQAGGIDAVSGATNSSNAVKNAVADTVGQAGGDKEAWLARMVEKNPGEDEIYDADIVVIGCGASGFIASCTAAKAGVKVITLEKGSNVLSVNGIKVSGPFAVDTATLHAKEGGTTLTVDDAFYHVMEYSHWTPNPALMRKCLDKSKDAVQMLIDFGYVFKEVNFRFETPFKGEKGGFHLITNKLEERAPLWDKALSDSGVQVIFDIEAKEILRDGDAIKGVYAERSDGTKVTVNAKAVIMASGGYLKNRTIQEQRLGTSKLNAAAGGTLCNGDGMTMAMAAGAGVEKTWGYCPCEYGGTNSKASRPAKQDKYDQNSAFKFGLYGNLLVDAQGKRFIDEGLLCDFPMSYGSEQILKNSPWYAVVDQAYVDAMMTQGLYNYTIAKGANEQNWFIGNYFKERILTNLPADIEEGLKEGWLWKADSLEELAKLTGLENLAETVAAYNSSCEAGVDVQFGTNPWYLSSIKEPPFYVTENEPSAWSTFGGIRIDENCRALTYENEIVSGLYSCGTDAGSLYYSPYYDIPGYCYGLCIDSGMIAGEEATKFIKG